jgi:hypothetical protein
MGVAAVAIVALTWTSSRLRRSMSVNPRGQSPCKGPTPSTASTWLRRLNHPSLYACRRARYQQIMPPDPVTQSTLVSQFCAITNTNTPAGADTAQRLLNENDWSIERALDRMYAEPAGASPRRTAGESSSIARGPPSPVKTTPGDGRPHVARLGLGRTTQESSGLLWPLKMVLRIVTSLWYLIGVSCHRHGSTGTI